MLGIRWEHRLQLWVLYEKSTDKIISKHQNEKDAKRAYYNAKAVYDPKKKGRRY